MSGLPRASCFQRGAGARPAAIAALAQRPQSKNGFRRPEPPIVGTRVAASHFRVARRHARLGALVAAGRAAAAAPGGAAARVDSGAAPAASPRLSALGPAPFIVTGLYLIYRWASCCSGSALLSASTCWQCPSSRWSLLVWLLWRRPARSWGPDVRGRYVAWPRVPGRSRVDRPVAANVDRQCFARGRADGGVVASFYVGLALQAGAAVLTSMLRLLLARKSIARFRVVSQRSGPLLEALGRLRETRRARAVGGNHARCISCPATCRAYGAKAADLPVRGGSDLRDPRRHRDVPVLGLDRLLVRTLHPGRAAGRRVAEDGLPRGVSNSVSTLSYYALVTVGLLVALAAAGFETSQFTIIFGALGVGIGFGLQNIVNNFVSGLILMFERPIQPGDVVEVSGTRAACAQSACGRRR